MQKRAIDPIQIESDKFYSLSPEAQALYIHLVVNALDKGRLKNAEMLAKGFFGIPALNELIQACYISKDVDGYFITDWDAHLLSDRKKRLSYSYRQWRKSVLERDGYKCAVCGGDTFLEVHHLKSFKEYPELRTSIDNGITLCRECHKQEHKKNHGEKKNV